MLFKRTETLSLDVTNYIFLVGNPTADVALNLCLGELSLIKQ